jgi:hypothetical protein
VCVAFTVCFNLCNAWVCVSVGVLLTRVIVFAVFCIVCTVFFVLFHLCIFLLVLSVLVSGLLPQSDHTIAVSK